MTGTAWRQAPTWFAVGTLAAAILWTGWLCDDAFITARSVSNLIHGYGFTWNIAERVQPYTHPAWALLLIPLEWAFGEAWWSLMVLSLSTTAGAIAIGRWAGQPLPSPALPFAALVGCKSFVDFSTSGLENPLVHLLLAVAVGTTLRDRPHLGLLGLAGGGMLVTRLDATAMVAPLILYGLWRRRQDLARDELFLAAVALVGPLAMWTLFSWVYYGYPLPNTAYAKLGNGVSQPALWAQGAFYVAVTFGKDPASLLALGLGLGLWVRRDPLHGAAIAAGVLAQLAWTVHVGGDFMEGRFVTGPIWMASLGLACLSVARPMWVHLLAAALGTLLTSSSAFRTGPGFGGPGGAAYRDRLTPLTGGVTDEREYYFAATSLVGLPWRPRPVDHPWIDAIPWFHEIEFKRTVGSVGFAGYYGGPDLHIVDHHALTDAFLARLPRDPAKPWRPGHYERTVPDGYLRTLETGEDHLTDPAHRALWEDVSWRTRDPVLDHARLMKLFGLDP